MNSPHTLRRGKRAFSTTATDQPARASRRAAVEPAGPAPMTIASNNRGQTTFFGDEKMAEQAGPALLQLPVRVRGPQRRQLPPGEPRPHREHGIVTRDVVAAEQAQHAAPGERERRAPRLARDEDVRPRGGERKKSGECRAFEMM